MLSSRFHYDSKPQKEPEIILTDDEIICYFPSSEKEEKIRWDEIDLMQILTTEDGPAMCDVFFVISNTKTKKGVVVPQDNPEAEHVLDRMLKFPGFDHHLFVEAMGSVQNKWFTVWPRIEA